MPITQKNGRSRGVEIAMGRKKVVVDKALAAPSRSVATLTAGSFNEISVPTGANKVLIIPPKATHVAWTLKGVTGDTGIDLAPNEPAYLSLKSTVTSFGLTLAAGDDFDVHLEWE